MLNSGFVSPAGRGETPKGWRGGEKGLLWDLGLCEVTWEKVKAGGLGSWLDAIGKHG